MSGLQFLEKLNKKLDQGWKLSNINCPNCKQTIVGHPKTKEFFCIKCDLPVKIMTDNEEMEVVDMVDTTTKHSGDIDGKSMNDDMEFDNMVLRQERRKRDDERSKKMGELMLQGWAMLAETCGSCLVPYMKSKKGEIICVGCGPINSQQSTPKPESQKPKQEQQITSIQKEEVKVEKKPEHKPVPQVKEVPKQTVVQEIIHDKQLTESKELSKAEKKVIKQAVKSQDFVHDSLELYNTITSALTKEVNRISQSETGESLLLHLEKIARVQSNIDQYKKNLKD